MEEKTTAAVMPTVRKNWDRKCHICHDVETFLSYAYPLPAIIDPFFMTGWLLCPKHLAIYESGRIERFVRLYRALKKERSPAL